VRFVSFDKYAHIFYFCIPNNFTDKSMITVTLHNGKIVECKKHKIKDILKELGLNENEVLVSCGDELLTPDICLKNGDEIKIISVVSGG